MSDTQIAAALPHELRTRTDPGGCTQGLVNGARVSCQVFHVDRPLSRWCRTCLLNEAADALTALLAQVETLTAENMKLRIQTGSDADWIALFRQQLREAEATRAKIACPACGETVTQVASATLGLALWQHYNWVCPKRAALADPPPGATEKGSADGE